LQGTKQIVIKDSCQEPHTVSTSKCSCVIDQCEMDVAQLEESNSGLKSGVVVRRVNKGGDAAGMLQPLSQTEKKRLEGFSREGDGNSDTEKSFKHAL
jgi:hypothetical protein